MRSVNKVILVGRVGKNPEIRQMQNGKEVASFSFVTSERWLDRSTNLYKEKADWHNIVVFPDALVRIVKDYVRKGSSLYLEGSIKTREYTDKEDKKRYVTEVHLVNFGSALVLLDSQGQQRSQSESHNESSGQPSDHQGNLQKASDGHEDGNENYSSFLDDFIDDEIPF